MTEPFFIAIRSCTSNHVKRCSIPSTMNGLICNIDSSETETTTGFLGGVGGASGRVTNGSSSKSKTENLDVIQALSVLVRTPATFLRDARPPALLRIAERARERARTLRDDTTSSTGSRGNLVLRLFVRCNRDSSEPRAPRRLPRRRRRYPRLSKC